MIRRLRALPPLILLAVLALAGVVDAAARQATPAPTGGTPYRVVAERTVTIPGRIYAPSLDGRWLAGSNLASNELCVYSVEAPDAPATCVALEANGIASIDSLRLAWSRDGTHLAFTEELVFDQHESDLWVLEVASGTLTNLTDDGLAGRLHDQVRLEETSALDMLPAWSPDGREITFVRSDSTDGEGRGTRLVRVSAGGGPVEEVLRVSDEEPFAIRFGMAYTPDGRHLVYTRSSQSQDHPDNGIWIVGRDGANPRHLAGATDSDFGEPMLLEISPRGDLAIVAGRTAMARAIPTPYLGLLDLATGETALLDLLVPDQPDYVFPYYATFSPDGASLLYYAGGKLDSDWLTVRDLATTTETTLTEAPGVYGLTAVSGLFWLTNWTILYSTGPTSAVLLTIDPPVGRPPADATPAATPAAAGTDDTVSGPSDPATIAAGSTLLVNEVAGGFRWVPIRDPASGTIGSIRAELLSPLT